MTRMLFGAWCALVLTHCVSHGPRIVGQDSDRDRTGRAISSAIAYLQRTQATAKVERSAPRAPFEGDWDQHLGVDLGPFKLPIHDTSPFISCCVVQSLKHVSGANAAALGIQKEDCERARAIRAQVMRLIPRFETREGTVGYWPPATTEPATIPQKLHAQLIRVLQKGPALHGTQAPRGVAGFPPEFRIPPDLDSTSMAWVARWIDHSLNRTSYHHRDPRAVIAPYVWNGRDAMYFPTTHVPPPGVFCTFCVPRGRPDIPRDVDLVVNCHILYSLALLGEKDSPAARRIISWILDTTRSGRHRQLDEVVMFYRWENAVPAAVTGCYHDGGVDSLAPAVKTLASDVKSSAITSRDGTVFWEGRSRVRSTAYGVLTLLNAGERGPLVDGGIRHLLSQQDIRSGGWRDDWVYMMESPNGRMIYVRSDASVTASALEALCRYQLSRGPAANRAIGGSRS